MSRRLAPWLVGVAAACALPFLVPGSFFLHVCILVFMWTALGAAWNVLGGFAGQVSFGHASLFGVGAYVTIILYLKAGIAPWWGIPVGGAAASSFSRIAWRYAPRRERESHSVATSETRASDPAAA